jgi:phosphoketolase
MPNHDDVIGAEVEPAGVVATLTGLPPELRDRMDAYWRAANYLSVGQIYL